jgi:hypothetical protein
MNIIDHFTNDIDEMVVVTLNDHGTVAVTTYDIDPQTGNSMLLENPTSLLLLSVKQAVRLADALAEAEDVSIEHDCPVCEGVA